MPCPPACSAPGGGLRFSVDRLLSLLSQPTRMVVVNFPHNPTGWLPSRAEWQRIVEACR